MSRDETVHVFTTTVGLRIGGIKTREEPSALVRIKYRVVGQQIVWDAVELRIVAGSWYPTEDFGELIDFTQSEELDRLMLEHAEEPMEEFTEVGRG